MPSSERVRYTFVQHHGWFNELRRSQLALWGSNTIGWQRVREFMLVRVTFRGKTNVHDLRLDSWRILKVNAINDVITSLIFRVETWPLWHRSCAISHIWATGVWEHRKRFDSRNCRSVKVAVTLTHGKHAILSHFMDAIAAIWYTAHWAGKKDVHFRCPIREVFVGHKYCQFGCADVARRLDVTGNWIPHQKIDTAIWVDAKRKDVCGWCHSGSVASLLLRLAGPEIYRRDG